MTEHKDNFDKPRLIVTHGEKGGVGKTTVARVLADYFNSRDVPFKAFDAEGEKGQLKRFHGSQTHPINVADAASVAPVLDYLMEANGKRLALVDLGARSGSDLKAWLYRGGALEEADASRLGITVAYVLGGAIDSVGHLKDCYTELGKKTNYVLIKNLGVANKFEVYDGSKTRDEILKIGGREITIPALDPAVYQSVDRASVSFAAFADNQGGKFGYTERRYCRTWLRECFVQLDEVGPMLN